MLKSWIVILKLQSRIFIAIQVFTLKSETKMYNLQNRRLPYFLLSSSNHKHHPCLLGHKTKGKSPLEVFIPEMKFALWSSSEVTQELRKNVEWKAHHMRHLKWFCWSLINSLYLIFFTFVNILYVLFQTNSALLPEIFVCTWKLCQFVSWLGLKMSFMAKLLQEKEKVDTAM